jgi:outer membrane lipase/esterase
VPSLDQQIGLFRLQGLPARSTDLFTVLAGANDLIDALAAPTTPLNPASLDAAGASAAQAVASNVQALIGLGAKNIVVGGLPNLGATPRALAQGGPGGPGATFGLRASTAFNNELRARLQTLAAGAPDVNLVYLDLQGVLDRLVADYAALGYANATSYVLAPAAQGGGGNPNNYVFFDDIHPTAKTHALLASVVLEQLNPELPLGVAAMQGSAALVLTGLGSSAVDARASQLPLSTRQTGRLDAYASFNYGDGVRGLEGWRPRFEYDAHVFTAGVDCRVSEGTFVGVAVGAGGLKAKSPAAEFDLEDGSGRAYAVWRGGPVSLQVDAGYGLLRVQDIRRATAFGGFATRGKTSGTHWGAGIKALWNAELGAASVRPWAGLRTERVRLDAYQETDVAALAMAVGEQEAESSSGAVGVDLSLLSQLGPRAARLDLRLAWHGELGSQDRDVSGRLANNFTRPTTISLEDGDGDGVEIGGAATLFFSKNWGASVGYTADIRSSERVAHRAMLSLQTGF